MGSSGRITALRMVLQIAISVSVNALIAVMAGSIAVFVAARPGWVATQRR